MQDHEGLTLAQHNNGYNWLPDFVYGGIDGAVTTFAVVAGASGASLSLPVILILGFANLVADGFSMASGKYSSDKANLEWYEKIRAIEFRHLKEKTEHERQEVRDILLKYNFKGDDLERATEVITSDPESGVDIMMRHEFNLTAENVLPSRDPITTFVSFLLIGFVPLAGYTFQSVLGLSESYTFLFAVFSTSVALFLVGAVKSRFSARSWFRSGLNVVMLGGFAAAISYGIGFLLRGLAG